MRGLACISVLAFHFLSRGPHEGLMPGVAFPLLEPIARFGYLGVHLFFVISGFVILMSAQGASPRNFIASRASRLYPALWIAATLTAGAAWMLSDARFAVTGGDYLANLSMVPHWFGIPYVDGAYWSLGYELHFYILVLVVIGLGWMKQLEWLLAGWLLVSAINAVRPMWPVEFWLNAKWAPFFAAGGVFYLVRTLGLTLRRLLLLAAAFALAQFYAIYRAPAAGSGSPLVVAAFITAIFVVFSLVAARRFQMKGSAWIYYAGALTYPLYVIHQNLGFMVYARLLALLDSVNAALALMLVLLLGLSWCVHAYVEAPLSPRLRRWLAKPRAAGSERAA